MRITHNPFARIGVLEGKRVRTTRFALISSGTTGSVALPANATVVLDDFGGTTDAVISTVTGGRPNFQAATTSGFVTVGTTFDASGNYVLTGTPSSYPVAIVYRIYQNLVDFDSTSTDILGPPHISGGGAAPDTASFLTVNTESTLSSARRIRGTANQVILTDGGGGNDLTLSLPQSIATSSSPTFAGLTLTGLSGAVSASGGVLSAGTLSTGNGGTGVASLSNILGTTNQVSVSGGTARVIGGDVTLSLPQSIATSSSPTFVNLGLTGYTDFTSVSADPSASSVGMRLYSLNVTVNDTLRMIDQAGNAFTIAQDQILSVRSTSGSTINKLAPVRFTGSFFTVSGQPIPVIATVHATKTTFADGVMFNNILTNTYGRMMRVGLISNCDTSGTPYGETWAAGDFIYLSSAVDGYLTHTPPSPPALVQLIGKVFSANATTGVFFVNVQNLHGYESGTSSNSWTLGDGTTNTAKQIIMNGLVGDLTISWTPAVGNWTLTIPQSAGNDTMCLTNMAQTLLSKTLSTSTVILTGGSYVKFTDATDNTKTVQFDASPLATATNRIMTFPNRAGTFVIDAYNDTASNAKAVKFDSSSNSTSTALTIATAQSTAQTLNVPNITASDTIATIGFAQTFSAANIFSKAGAASTAAVKLSGAPFTGGSATTTKPLFWIEDAVTTNGWSTSGTYLGINAASAFVGNLMHAQVNAADIFKVDYTGAITSAGVAVPTISSTSTFTNKRITFRVVTGSTGTTVTPTGDTADIYKQTLNGHGTITMAAPTGTPIDGDFLELIIIQDSTGSGTFSWNSIYVWTTDIAAVITGSGPNKKDRFLWQYESGVSKWVAVARNLGQ